MHTPNSEGFKETYTLSYKKIQNLLAEIGGFLNFIRIIFTTILFVNWEIMFTPIAYRGYSYYLDNNKINNAQSSVKGD